MSVSCVDLFCGAGGLTHGFVKKGIHVAAGIDLDEACRYPYEKNNDSKFIGCDVSELSVEKLNGLFDGANIKVLAGCAPCQPFSSYAQRYDVKRNERWGLLYEFVRLAKGVLPDVITMENVPTVERHKVFCDFIQELESVGYHVWHKVVDCSHYGVPQSRKRLVLLASLHGPIRLMDRTRRKAKTVRQAIGHLKEINAGESARHDRLHISASLSTMNFNRIKASTPGGTWRDWPKHLVADCHKYSSGHTYPSVYGRMEWDKPSPTMTTQCYGYGNGRFGHPEQDRAISIREAAILQGFPRSYKFVRPGEPVFIKTLGRLIGNAVPVGLGEAIAKSINLHLEEYKVS